jgi:uncharacterized membrane protein
MRPEICRAEYERLEEQALAYLKRSGSMSVEKLYDALQSGKPSVTRAEVTDLVWRLVETGKAKVEDIPPATTSIREYLGFWERNLGLYLSLAVCAAALLVVYAFPPSFPLVAFRWVLGSMFVLFIPGYVAVEALFPKSRELDGIERLALSIGLSMALVSLTGLMLNYTPLGIRLEPITISLTILTVGLALVALVRRFRLSAERFELQQLS